MVGVCVIYYFPDHRLLKDNPELYQLYKDLVVSGVITAEEFWANRATKVTELRLMSMCSFCTALCLGQEHNSMTLARTQTWTCQCDVPTIRPPYQVICMIFLVRWQVSKILSCITCYAMMGEGTGGLNFLLAAPSVVVSVSLWFFYCKVLCN